VTFWLGLFSLVLMVKGLGGSFHSLLRSLNVVEFHGPIVATLFSVFAVLFYRSYARDSDTPLKQPGSIKRLSPLFLIFFLIIVGTGTFQRIQRIHQTPLNPDRADMIPCILAGFDSVMQGKSPYHPQKLFDGTYRPHYYPPTLWMGYLPFYLMGVDIRYWNLIAQLLIFLVLLDVFARLPYERQKIWPNQIIFLALIALVAFSKQLIRDTADVHTATLTFTYAVFIWSVFRRWTWVTRLIIPILILSRESGFLLVLPYFFFLFLSQRKEFYRTTGIALVIGMLFVIPFILASPKEFFGSTIYYASIAHTHSPATLLSYYGLGGVLKVLGLNFLAWPFRLIGLVWSLVFLYRNRSKANAISALAFGAISYLIFMLFVPITWNYVYIQSLFLTLFLLAGDPCQVLIYPKKK